MVKLIISCLTSHETDSRIWTPHNPMLIASASALPFSMKHSGKLYALAQSKSLCLGARMRSEGIQ